MPKPVYATVEDVRALEDRSNQSITKVEGSIPPAVAAAEQRLQAAIANLSDTLAQNAATQKAATDRMGKECREYTDQTVNNLNKQLSPLIQQLDKKLDDVEARLTAKCDGVQKDGKDELRRTIEELAINMGEELTALKAEVMENLEAAKKDMFQADADQRKEIDASITGSKKEAAKLVKLGTDKVTKDMDEFKQAQNKKDKSQDENNQVIQNEIFLKLDRQGDLMKETADNAEGSVQRLKEMLQMNFEGLAKDHGGRLRYLDNETEKMRNAVAEVENIATKKVDWVINNVSKRIRPNSASKASLHRSWFSPKFNIAGAHGLQLELQLYRPTDTPAKDEECGDAAIFLWACKGITLSFRLYIGTKYQTMEKTFNGRVPFGTKRFVFLKDMINRNDDNLKVSVEILESHRVLEHCIEVPPDPDMPAGIDPPERALDGLVHFHRHVNNRLYDQVKNQVDLMKSRMTRRVEWKIQQASRLRPCFPMGDCICSTQFNAAGLEGLQMLFYPSGYNGATDGYCSLYIYGPSGCTMKCNLILGTQKREASHSFIEPGAFGRTNFCQFQQCVEDDDTILVAMEITEAHQDSVAQASHPTVAPGDKRSQAQIDGVNSAPVNSIVKLQQKPGAACQGLDDVRVLPSLWTAYFKDSVNQPPDGMHGFDELKVKKAKKRDGPHGGQGEPAASPNLRGSESMPSLTNSSTRGFGDDKTASPLPQLANSGASFGATAPSPGGHKSGGARRPRRQGGMANTTSSMGITAC